MAKKRRRRPKTTERSRVERDVGTISKRRRQLFKRHELLRDVYKDRPIIQDRRRYLPKMDDFVRDYVGRRVNYVLRAPKRKVFKYRDRTRDWLSFANPKRVPLCTRRKLRRKVLFGLDRIGRGKGGAGRAKRRMTPESRVRC